MSSWTVLPDATQPSSSPSTQLEEDGLSDTYEYLFNPRSELGSSSVLEKRSCKVESVKRGADLASMTQREELPSSESTTPQSTKPVKPIPSPVLSSPSRPRPRPILPGQRRSNDPCLSFLKPLSQEERNERIRKANVELNKLIHADRILSKKLPQDIHDHHPPTPNKNATEIKTSSKPGLSKKSSSVGKPNDSRPSSSNVSQPYHTSKSHKNGTATATKAQDSLKVKKVGSTTTIREYLSPSKTKSRSRDKPSTSGLLSSTTFLSDSILEITSSEDEPETNSTRPRWREQPVIPRKRSLSPITVSDDEIEVGPITPIKHKAAGSVPSSPSKHMSSTGQSLSSRRPQKLSPKSTFNLFNGNAVTNNSSDHHLPKRVALSLRYVASTPSKPTSKKLGIRSTAAPPSQRSSGKVYASSNFGSGSSLLGSAQITSKSDAEPLSRHGVVTSTSNAGLTKISTMSPIKDEDSTKMTKHPVPTQGPILTSNLGKRKRVCSDRDNLPLKNRRTDKLNRSQDLPIGTEALFLPSSSPEASSSQTPPPMSTEKHPSLFTPEPDNCTQNTNVSTNTPDRNGNAPSASRHYQGMEVPHIDLSTLTVVNKDRARKMNVTPSRTGVRTSPVKLLAPEPLARSDTNNKCDTGFGPQKPPAEQQPIPSLPEKPDADTPEPLAIPDTNKHNTGFETRKSPVEQQPIPTLLERPEADNASCNNRRSPSVTASVHDLDHDPYPTPPTSETASESKDRDRTNSNTVTVTPLQVQVDKSHSSGVGGETAVISPVTQSDTSVSPGPTARQPTSKDTTRIHPYAMPSITKRVFENALNRFRRSRVRLSPVTDATLAPSLSKPSLRIITTQSANSTKIRVSQTPSNISSRASHLPSASLEIKGTTSHERHVGANADHQRVSDEALRLKSAWTKNIGPTSDVPDSRCIDSDQVGHGEWSPTEEELENMQLMYPPD
ncbi:hypothetical protein K435DRAFT_848321 [Dendrothele bispora CBS 962.96]|uniref:Uncharacterized protein n=1 Tax=Dendrothele bispora (strain CBS 962.96) TaxID=1314807 RepID=A0A4S8MVR9_DENBC|nr:hypothetical protein K435DRAFT_848321 [Dendrothele bispora CBS 962.96]